jgi:hypothetical protein
MLGKLVIQGVKEITMFALTEHVPDFFMRESAKGSKLEFHQVILSRVKIDSMNSLWRVVHGGVSNDVIASRRNGKDNILGAKAKKTDILIWILPGEGINVLVVELVVLRVLSVVKDTPHFVLIVERWVRHIADHVDNRRLISLGSENYLILETVDVTLVLQVCRS